LELGVSYFSFIAVVLAALLNPVWVALGAPLGELVFSDMLLGDFAGLSELEGYLETALAIYIAGVIVRDPCRRAQLALACVTMVLIDKVSGGIIDIVKVAVGIDPETLEESDGLFSAFVIAEGLDIIVTVAFSGVLFGILPAIWLAPRLYGKIEPIMGLRPRDPADPPRLRGPGGIGFWLVAVFAVVAAAAIALLAAWEEFVGKQGLSTIGSFELGADGQPGFGLLAVFGAVVVALGIIIVLAVASKRRRRSVGEGEGQR
ncbi:MAG TPA: cell division protein FtsQ, partial [Brevibacterium epidermidis]|nr:cell division protein FtsQ [Brevibacterium epidermidis]